MGTFLTIVAGMVVGGILLLLVLFFGIKFFLRRFLNKLATALGNVGQGVPPFRITVQQAGDLEWKNKKAVDGIAAALKGGGYANIGDFQINEMPSVQLRALVNTKVNSYAAIMEFGEKIVLDVVSDFTDDDHVTISNAPETGLDRPDWSRMIRVDADLVADPSAAVKLHERLLAEQKGRPTVAATAEAFPAKFIKAHTREMDWRIARGGVTADEVRRSCEANGTDPPTDDGVEMVIAGWRSAISQFVDDELREKFLKHITKMSAAEWEEVRDRLYFVHERSDPDRVIGSIAWRLNAAESANSTDENGDDDDAEDRARQRLQPMFTAKPVREAFASAQELLPANHRFRRVAGIKTPFAADVYVEPASADNGDD